MITKLSENEYLIMKLLWQSNNPLSRAEILKNAHGKWNPASINIILNNMVDKGVIKVVNPKRKYGKTFLPVLQEDDYSAECVINGTPGKPEKDRLMSVVCGMVKRDGINSSDINEIELYLAELKKKMLKNNEGEC